MFGFAKFLVGALAVAMVGLTTHALDGADYIETIEQRARLSLGELPDADLLAVSMPRAPLSRTAVVNGPLSEAEREIVTQRLQTVVGVRDVRFVGDAFPTPPATRLLASAAVLGPAGLALRQDD